MIPPRPMPPIWPPDLSAVAITASASFGKAAERLNRAQASAYHACMLVAAFCCRALSPPLFDSAFQTCLVWCEEEPPCMSTRRTKRDELALLRNMQQEAPTAINLSPQHGQSHHDRARDSGSHEQGHRSRGVGRATRSNTATGTVPWRHRKLRRTVPGELSEELSEELFNVTCQALNIPIKAVQQ